MQEGSLFSTPSPAFIVCRLFDDGHSDWFEVVSHPLGLRGKAGGGARVTAGPKRQGSPASSSVWREDPGLLSRPGHRSEWPSSKSLQTINAEEDVEKREPSCTVGARGEGERVLALALQDVTAEEEA